jgi:very-short-patch-repair endonuclease
MEASLAAKYDLAKDLRRRQTLPEQKMWWLLRSRGFNGYKFRRQCPIGPFIVDFCCQRAKLVVELDGFHHSKTTEYDEERSQYLGQKGYQVLRFWNDDFLNDQSIVLEKIRLALSTCPLPRSRGRGCPKGG